jgi:hypothetical protein
LHDNSFDLQRLGGTIEVTVRGMPLKKSGVRGLCWLLRAVD